MVASKNKVMTSNKSGTTEVQCGGGQPKTTYFNSSLNIDIITINPGECVLITIKKRKLGV
jgi:hypothetical protein